MKVMCRTFIVVGLAAALAANGFGAVPRRSGNKKNGPAEVMAAKLEEWKREVKKLEAAPVADGFVAWKGLDTIKCARNARWLAPSDLRGRFVIVVEIDPSKLVEQLKTTHKIVSLGFDPPWMMDWDFAPISRDVVVVFNLYDLSEESLAKKVLENDEMKPVTSHDFNFYGHVTFDGAPDASDERPYVYVMRPEGRDPIYKGKVVETAKTCREIAAAIKQVRSELSTWRPWHGYVTEVKHVKGFDSAVRDGKGLAPFSISLKKGIVSKNAEVAAESQRLYDAIEQRKGDLFYLIKKEWNLSPCAARYDMDELSARFPAVKRELASYDEKISKAHPNLSAIYKHYALYRRCSDPSFRAKSASEAKKLAAELVKAKPILTKMSDDAKDVALQNVALSLLQRIDEVIEELPTKVMQK